MATDERLSEDEGALRILETLYGVDVDEPDDEPVDPQMLARLRTAVDQGFDRAWRDVRARARAEREASASRRIELVTWTRDQLLSMLASLADQLGPQLQLAHRKLDALSTDDLRALVADLEAEVARHEASSS